VSWIWRIRTILREMRGPTVWWDGRVVGGWAQRRDGEIVFRLLEDIGADAVRAVGSEAVRLATWLGEARFAVGFLRPFSVRLRPSP
jgi:hypothetical protein